MPRHCAALLRAHLTETELLAVLELSRWSPRLPALALEQKVAGCGRAQYTREHYLGTSGLGIIFSPVHIHLRLHAANFDTSRAQSIPPAFVNRPTALLLASIRTSTLPDGSSMQLNTRTLATMEIDTRSRAVTIHHGEALLKSHG